MAMLYSYMATKHGDYDYQPGPDTKIVINTKQLMIESCSIFGYWTFNFFAVFVFLQYMYFLLILGLKKLKEHYRRKKYQGHD